MGGDLSDRQHSDMYSPPVTDTDIDYIICSQLGGVGKLVNYLQDRGFSASCQDREEYDLGGEGFYCLRRGKVNLIVTGDYDFYLKFVEATKLAKKLNLMDKTQRIVLFQYVLYRKL